MTPCSKAFGKHRTNNLTSYKNRKIKFIRMKKLSALLFTFAWLTFLWITGCSSDPGKQVREITYNAKVSAFTSGTISNESTIRIQFSDPVQSATPGQGIGSSLVKFKPSIKGEATWLDAQTIVFEPTDRLPSNTVYTAKVNLSELYPTEKPFEFSFQTIEQNFRIEDKGLSPDQPDDLKQNTFTGQLIMADHANNEQVETILHAHQDGRELEIEWEHYPAERMHQFRVRDVQRKDKTETLVLEYDGKKAGIDKDGEKEIEIPALDAFKVMDVRVVLNPDQYILVTFSDPLQTRQDINGLIAIENVSDLRYSIENNEVKVYPPRKLTGSNSVVIYPGIKNALGYTFKGEERYNLTFEALKPDVQLLGKGTILPNSKGLIFPFRAVSLKGVELRIIKIFENNVSHFLQANQLDGEYQLKRAGRLVLKKNIPLDSDRSLDLTKWNTFSFDLANLIAPEPGAIYRVIINFNKSQSIYPCEDTEEEIAEEPAVSDDLSESEMTYWDSPDSYYYSYWDEYDYDYNWSEREDPCSSSYYHNRSVSRNILASDLGIIAKQGTNKEVVVAVTDLRSTHPLSNVQVDIVNYQNQVVGQARTDGKGLARIPVSQKPYLLIAKNDKQRGYLRLDDGSSLSLSRFDVSGQVVQKGMKGFIYGERGVWRPGDTLFISFIMENKGEKLPADHPVVFELVNPHGQTINRQVTPLSNQNLLCFKAQTAPDAPTGMWICRIKVGGTTFEKGLRVETIKPNRLKINLDFNTDKLSPSTSAEGQMEVKWLHGAIARNLDANVTVTLNRARTTFKKYADFTFDDPARDFDSEEVNIFDGKLDNEGKATINADIDVQEAAPGMLKASFRTRVFEESGDFSVDRFTIPYAPYPVFVGIKPPTGDKRGMLLTDKSHEVEVVTLDPEGNPVDVANLEYQVYEISWRWWWEASEDDLARYVGSGSNNLILSGKLSTKKGRGSFKFKIDYPEWGRYLLRVVDNRNGHATGKTVYVDWPGWASRPSGSDPEAASMLSFSADEDKYEVGDKATISFPSAGVGRALVSIENGNKVIKNWWVETEEEMTDFSFEVTPDMTPNVYVHLTLVQPHAKTANDLPIRLYGVIPILVEDPASHLKPVLKMPEELKPEKKVTIKVSEDDDKPMTYTLAVVDEGLLDLTRFATPKPWHHFFAREALGVRSWDMYNWVLGAFGGRIEQVFSIGGDEAMKGKKTDNQANRFKPMVKFMGPFKLKAGETNAHTFMVPRYVGSVRTMVIAASDKAYGTTQKTTPVRNPLMVLATLPRVLGPNETVDLPVTVFAMKKEVKQVSLKLEANELFTIEGDQKQTLQFTETGDKVATFRLKVNPKIGIGKVKVIAKSNGETAIDEIELEVRNPNPPLTTFVSQVVDPGKKIDLAYTLPGMTGTNKATLEISAIPPIDFGRRLKYLIQYPHGCVEQTTSSAFPQLFLTDVVDNGDVLKAKTEKNVKATIRRLSGFIQPDGGLGYWPNSTSSCDWGTTYAGHFMLEAEKKGYALPVGFKKKWLKYQRKQARQWSRSANNRGSEFAQAYRLYTLALAGEPEMSTMNRLRNQNSLSNQTKWRLAAAYALSGYEKVANELIAQASIDAEDGNSYRYTYGSYERDQAMILETLTILKKRNEAAPVLQRLSKRLSGNNWMSTQTTAYCLLAVSKFAGTSATSKSFAFTWNGPGKQGETVKSQKPVYQTELNVKDLSGKIAVTNKSDGIIYSRIVMEGIPAEGDQTAQASNLQISVEYLDLNGNKTDVTRLQQGTDFMAVVSVNNPGTLGHQENVALTQIFPSGWEIRNTRMEDIQSAYEISQPDYRDIRDDRVYSYFDLAANQRKKMIVLLNASYTGRFYLPAVSCGAMYDNEVAARQPGQWVEVVKAGESLDQ
ncbi:hypothetical protein DMA11_15785 [Marinilabiliaceae bacterium JC017]|nr:hypothetical protein DMA11_15785 [Marinilabiliaceae bacterium JC017]